MEKATFAAGCFWHVQKVFDQVEGVLETRVGFAGGKVKTPSYEEVCQGATGHAESIEILFDPQKISYEELLETFWKMHDPTTPNQQGPDIGSQYRSAIFYHTPEQQKTAEHSMEKKSEHLHHPIVTEITKGESFYEAEAHHQKYFEKKS